MKKHRALLALCLSLCASSSFSAGLYLYEIGSDEVGLAGAGFAARAQDPSVMAFNPAGIARLSGNQWFVGGQVLYGDVNYTLDDHAALRGNSPGNVLGFFPGASLFYSHSVSDRLKLGFATYGNFGLGLKFGDWAGSRLLRDTTLIAMTFQPSLAYRVSDTLSLGVGLGLNYGFFSLKRDAANGSGDQQDTDWAINAKLGLLYEPNPQTRFGLFYASPQKYHFDIKGQVTLSYSLNRPLLPPVSVSKTIELPVNGMVNAPQQVMMSAYHALTPRLALMGNVGWQEWSAYGENTVMVRETSLPANDRLRDTWHMALGAQYELNPGLILNTGIAYDTSFYKSQRNVSLTMPSGAAWRFGAGATTKLSPKSDLGVAFEFVRIQGGHVGGDLLSGDYAASKLYFMGVNYKHHF